MDITNFTENSLRYRLLYTEIFQHFMELEGSLSYSQELSTGAYPEPE
jgi:hypothetical protein